MAMSTSGEGVGFRIARSLVRSPPIINLCIMQHLTVRLYKIVSLRTVRAVLHVWYPHCVHDDYCPAEWYIVQSDY